MWWLVRCHKADGPASKGQPGRFRERSLRCLHTRPRRPNASPAVTSCLAAPSPPVHRPRKNFYRRSSRTRCTPTVSRRSRRNWPRRSRPRSRVSKLVSMVVPTVQPSDETLAARAAAGDDRAFEAIVERYQGRVYRLACRLTSDTDAPDVLQDTFLQVYRHLPSFRGESQFGTWLYRIATNSALMLRRARARRPAES